MVDAFDVHRIVSNKPLRSWWQLWLFPRPLGTSHHPFRHRYCHKFVESRVVDDSWRNPPQIHHCWNRLKGSLNRVRLIHHRSSVGNNGWWKWQVFLRNWYYLTENWQKKHRIIKLSESSPWILLKMKLARF